MKMRLICSISFFLGGAAHAGIPLLNATCPGEIFMHADQGGPVFINGKEAKLTVFSDNSYEATGAGIAISISINPDGSAIVAYTGKHGVNGVCEVKQYAAQSGTGANGGAPAPALPSSAGNTLTAPANMPAFCRGEAARMFATQPRYITTGRLSRAGAGYVVKGKADLGNEGNKPFQCEFSERGQFMHFKSLVDEGKL
jgi:hypothetical protein